jgi:retinol dehydrogenase 12
MPGIPQFLHGQLFQTPTLPKTDLTGQTIIVTGANTGLGLEASKHLVRLNVSHLILACRNLSKGEAAKEQILASARKTATKIEVWPLDLCSYISVVDFATRCNTLLRLDAVVENAGVSYSEYTRAEDNETTITVNVVSTFLLALLLLPKLRESAAQFNITPRLPIVGSAVHFWAATAELTTPAQGKIFDTLSDQKSANMAGRYFLSKLIVMHCIRELAARISASSAKHGSPTVIVSNVAPGWCRTDLFRHEDGGAGQRMALKVIGRSSEEGSRTLVHGAVAGKEVHGQYVSECQVKPASAFVRSKEGEKLQKRIWEELMAKLERISPGISANL